MSDWTQSPAKTEADRHTIRLARYAAREEFFKWASWAVVVGFGAWALLRIF